MPRLNSSHVYRLPPIRRPLLPHGYKKCQYERRNDTHTHTHTHTPEKPHPAQPLTASATLQCQRRCTQAWNGLYGPPPPTASHLKSLKHGPSHPLYMRVQYEHTHTQFDGSTPVSQSHQPLLLSDACHDRGGLQQVQAWDGP